MSLRNPNPALLFAFAALFASSACSSSSSGEVAPPPPDTGTDTGTDSTVKDSTPDTNDAAPADTFDSAKPDTTVTDTGPGEDTAAKLFACGTETCNKDFQYCRQPAGTGTAGCVLYPTACGFASCTCLIDKTVSGTPATCKGTPTPTCAETDGAFTITCDAP